MADIYEKFTTARAAAAKLHDRAIVLGYKVSANVGGDLSKEPEASFWVRQVDQPSGTEQTFTATAEVKQYLDHLATLPRYRLELTGNPRVEVISETDGSATWVTDKETGEHFAVRTADLESANYLLVHAETPPTIGNWQRI